MVASVNRICRDCGKTKPVDEFYFTIKSKGLRQSYCKPCSKARAARYQRISAGKDPDGPRSRRSSNPIIDGKLVCLDCEIEKPVEEFHYNSTSRRPFPYCKSCLALRGRMRQYRISRAEAALLAMKWTCDACGEPISDQRSQHIDHDHETGRVRGVLCHGCNLGIGHLGDRPETVRRALDYLERAADASRKDQTGP